MNEIDFLKEILSKYDKSLELMNGLEGELYREIQDRIENLTKHN